MGTERKHVGEILVREPARAQKLSKQVSINRLNTHKDKKPCLQISPRERRLLSRNVPSVILWRKMESTRSGLTFGVCLDAKQARPRASPILMPTKAKALSGMKTP